MTATLRPSPRPRKGTCQSPTQQEIQNDVKRRSIGVIASASNGAPYYTTDCEPGCRKDCDIAVHAQNSPLAKKLTTIFVNSSPKSLLSFADNLAGYHGRPKPRKRQETYWTHRKGRGAFGYKLWKKWFNNAAMNKLEYRLRCTEVLNKKREWNERYGLRKLEARRVDSKEARDSRGVPW
jgi:hypothetical protein